jgi:uncharacterized membrane protein (UPF0127 family)
MAHDSLEERMIEVSGRDARAMDMASSARFRRAATPGARPARSRHGHATMAFAALLFGVACGVGGEGASATREAPTPLLSQEAGASGETGSQAAGELVAMRVAGREIRVEIADDEAERAQGLMNRESLPEDQGMLFVYPSMRRLSFWMKNTRIPLDIAFIDESGLIVDIQQMEPENEELHTSSQPAMYALEMSLGWFEANGVKTGDRVEF